MENINLVKKMDKIGLKQLFIGQFELYQTDNIGKYVSYKPSLPEFIKATTPPIIVSLDEIGMWISGDIFRINNGDLFRIIKN